MTIPNPLIQYANRTPWRANRGTTFDLQTPAMQPSALAGALPCNVCVSIPVSGVPMPCLTGDAAGRPVGRTIWPDIITAFLVDSTIPGVSAGFSIPMYPYMAGFNFRIGWSTTDYSQPNWAATFGESVVIPGLSSPGVSCGFDMILRCAGPSGVWPPLFTWLGHVLKPSPDWNNNANSGLPNAIVVQVVSVDPMYLIVKHNVRCPYDAGTLTWEFRE